VLPRAAVKPDEPARERLAPAGRQRVIVEHVQPEIDGGRFAIKRTPGETVVVTVDVFAEGHDLLEGVLKYRPAGSRNARAVDAAGPGRTPGSGVDASAEPAWREVALTPLDNDSWTASFVVEEFGRYEYTIEAWIDRFGSWLKGLVAKADAGQDVASELLEGAALVQAAGTDDRRLIELAQALRADQPQLERVALVRDPVVATLMRARADRRTATRYDRILEVIVDPERARFGAWYEMFPRSSTPDPKRSGTFQEAEARLPELAAMGFDVIYLPPIHPIGRSFRKGRNNSLTPEPGDPGSPWAIGSPEGGHTAIEPGLGTFDDFARFVETARRLQMQVALDIAFQASPDHPWASQHPEWFRHRPDGSIKYAENPPKKYQDIYPLDFESDAWQSLWEELKQVFLFWAARGVTIFRVDNPHTKPFRFWEWCIGEVKREYPEAIFLSEAFTRPKVMRYLAKCGFTQSYTYFTWRNSAQELREYLTELTTTEVREYMRPNFFTNTPDILHEYLQHGGRPAFEVRLILAATLAASYGIYSGYELCENVAVRPGSEEYLDSEKYQIRMRDWNAPGHIKELIARINQIRRDHRALQFNEGLRFHTTDNPTLLWFSKSDVSSRNDPRPHLFVVANTDPHRLQHGWVEVPLADVGLAADETYVVEDLLDGARYTWRGAWNYVRLDPSTRMAHIFRIVTGES
jgi:starch synthase (maltosyl-transferring)